MSTPIRLQRTPAESAILEEKIRAGIIAGKAVAHVARAVGIPVSYCYVVMKRRLGVRKVLLLPEERAIIARVRGTKAK